MESEKKNRGKIKVIKRLLAVTAGIIGLVVVAFVILTLILTVLEYRPEDREPLSTQGNSSKELLAGDTITVMSWNIGFGALGDNADFFMDGGTHVMPSTKDRVLENLNGISEEIQSVNPDIVFLQEVDSDSKRSYYIDQRKEIMEGMDGYQSSCAYNYKVLYVPYPLPPIGKVESGLSTLSSYEMNSAERVALPCPFSYPIRVANLKRCLMVNRVPIHGSDKELVLVNLHLEAYDSGEGKEAQTAMLKELLEIEADAGNYVIAGGDFNQEFSNVDTSLCPQISEELWEAGVIDVEEFPENLQCITDDSVPTCRSLDQPYEGADKENFQYYMIDGFIVSDNLTVESLETRDLEFQNSDHNPLVLVVTMQ